MRVHLYLCLYYFNLLSNVHSLKFFCMFVFSFFVINEVLLKKKKVALLAHKALTTGMPSYIASTLSPHSHVRSLRSESSNFLNIPIPRNKFEAKSFKFSAPRTWNGLPPQLRASDSFSLFKANLKTHLFPQQRRTKRP